MALAVNPQTAVYTATDYPHADRLGNQTLDEEPPLDPVARAKANNRRAQQRWRARQREVKAGYRQTIEELTKQTEELTQEKAKLETRLASSADNSHPGSSNHGRPTLTVPQPASMQDKLAAMLPPLLTFLKLLGMKETSLPTSIDLDYLRGSGPDGCNFLAAKKLVFEELARCVREGGEVVGSPANKRLKEVIRGKQKLFMEWTKVDSSLWRLVEVGLRRDPCPRDLWHRVLEAMQLSAQDKMTLLELRQRLLNDMQGIIMKREQALAVLRSASPNLVEDRSSAASYVHANQASEELAASLAAEAYVRQRFVADVFEHGMSPLQHARASLAVAPWCFDMLAVCNTLAEEAGETPAAGAYAHELLGPRHDVPPHLHSRYLEAPLPKLQHLDIPCVPEDPQQAFPHLSSDLDLDLELDDPLLADDSMAESSWMAGLSGVPLAIS